MVEVVSKLAGFRMSQDARYRWHQTVLECPTGVVPLRGHGKQSSKLLLVLGGKKIIEGPSPCNDFYRGLMRMCGD